jgi:hypothetical protein
VEYESGTTKRKATEEKDEERVFDLDQEQSSDDDEDEDSPRQKSKKQRKDDTKV